MGASLPSKDSDLKACVEEVGENSRAKIAGSLCEIWMLMSLQGHRRGRARGVAEGTTSYPCQCDFCDTTHVVEDLDACLVKMSSSPSKRPWEGYVVDEVDGFIFHTFNIRMK